MDAHKMTMKKICRMKSFLIIYNWLTKYILYMTNDILWAEDDVHMLGSLAELEANLIAYQRV